MANDTDETLKNASATIASRLGVSAESVTVGVGTSPEDRSGGRLVHTGDPKDSTNILIKVKNMQGLELDPQAAEKKVLAALNDIPAVAAIAQTVPEETQAVALLDQLKKVAEGTNFNPKLLEWKGFDPAVAKDSYKESSHAIRVSEWQGTSLGVEVNVTIPVAKDVDPKTVQDTVTANLTERLPAIREVLTQRVQKYTAKNMEGKPAEEIAQAQAKVAEDIKKMEIAVNSGEPYDGTGNVNIVLRSPEQQEAFKKFAGNAGAHPDNEETLRKSNPLSALSNSLSEDQKKNDPDASTQLEKALGRAFLTAGDKAMDIFPVIAGRKDMKGAIGRQLANVIKDHPEKADAAKAILESDLFKSHDWSADPANPGTVKPSPMIIKRAENTGEMEVWLQLPKAKVRETLEGIATLSAAPAAAANAPAPAAQVSATAPATQDAEAPALAAAPSFIAPEALKKTQQPTPQEASGWQKALTKVVPDALLPESWVAAEKARNAATAANDGVPYQIAK